MVITGTDQIEGILTIEVRDDFLKAIQKLAIRAGESYVTPDSFRYAPAVVDAVELGLITLDTQEHDEAAQEDLTGGGGDSQLLYKALTLTNGFTINHDDARTVRITAAGTVVSSDTNAIANGSDTGQRLTLIVPGQSQKITILDDANTNLDGPFVAKGPGAGGSGNDSYTFMCLELEWNGSQWVELARKLHVGDAYAERSVAFNGNAKGFKSFAIFGNTYGELSTSIGGTALGVASISHGNAVANGENSVAFQESAAGATPISYTISGAIVSVDGDYTAGGLDDFDEEGRVLFYNLQEDAVGTVVLGQIIDTPTYDGGSGKTVFTIDGEAAAIIANRNGTLANQNVESCASFGSAIVKGSFAFGANNAQARGRYTAAFGSGNASAEYAFSCNQSSATAQRAFSANTGTANGTSSAAFGASTSSGNRAFAAGNASVSGENSFAANLAQVGGYSPVTNAAGFNTATVENSEAFACNNAIASGLQSFAQGTGDASGEKSVAMNNSLADGLTSFAANDANAEAESSAAFNSGYSSGAQSAAFNYSSAAGDGSFSAGYGAATGDSSVAFGSGGTATHEGEFVHGLEGSAPISQTGRYMQYATTEDDTPVLVNSPEPFIPIITNGILYDEVTIMAVGQGSDGEGAKFKRAITMHINNGVAFLDSEDTIGTDYKSYISIDIDIQPSGNSFELEVIGISLTSTLNWLIVHDYTIIGNNDEIV